MQHYELASARTIPWTAAASESGMHLIGQVRSRGSFFALSEPDLMIRQVSAKFNGSAIAITISVGSTGIDPRRDPQKTRSSLRMPPPSTRSKKKRPQLS